jgi:hypothetical protein
VSVRGRTFGYSTTLEQLDTADPGLRLQVKKGSLVKRMRAAKMMAEEITAAPPAKFCRECGKEMVGRVEPLGYDPQTGAPVLVAYAACPDAKQPTDYDLRPYEHMRLTCKGEW